MNFSKVENIYFLGVGGIGMSALARYFNFIGKKVSGYDKTRTELTAKLEEEGISIHYEDNVDLIGDLLDKPKDSVLVVITPAIPENHSERIYFYENNYTVYKRAQVLGLLTRTKKGIAISGTHGKTTVTTMTTHLLSSSKVMCSAFLGGISKNYNSNFIFSDKSEYIVVEADEYDRSFHQLTPSSAVITSMDADHLDIYGSHEEIFLSFYEFINKIEKGGYLVYKYGLNISPAENTLKLNSISVHTYSVKDTRADFYSKNHVVESGFYTYDIVTPFGVIENVKLGVSGMLNVENSIAATALALQAGVEFSEVKHALSTFSGVARRFDYQINSPKVVFIDDYAHHPEELRAFISSVVEIYKGRKITGIFQPHLFSRTQDFAPEFAQSLSLLNELWLLDIYPAREKPIPGVTSDIIFDKVTAANKRLCTKDEILSLVDSQDVSVLLVMGAGDVDTLVKPIKTKLLKKYNIE